MHLRSAMQYKYSFFMTLVGQFMTSFSAFISIYILFLRFGNVDGYTFEEVLICYACVLFSYTCAECFFRGFDVFPSLMKSGSFDRTMVQPRSPMFLVLCSRIEFARAGRFLQAAVIMVYAVVNSTFIWNAKKIAVLILMCISGSAMFSGLFIIYASLCFFTLDGLEFMNIFTDGGRELGKYPLDIYGKNILKFFTYIIPLACVQYWPFTYISGRSDSVIRCFMPLFGIIFLILCTLIWKIGLRRYKSAGS